MVNVAEGKLCSLSEEVAKVDAPARPDLLLARAAAGDCTSTATLLQEGQILNLRVAPLGVVSNGLESNLRQMPGEPVWVCAALALAKQRLDGTGLIADDGLPL